MGFISVVIFRPFFITDSLNISWRENGGRMTIIFPAILIKFWICDLILT